MAIFFRVTLPDDDGSVAITDPGAAYSVVGATELAVMVGTSVPLQRCGSELRSLLQRWADQPKDPDTTVGGTNVKTYLAVPGVAAEQLTIANAALATAPTETQWGIVVGDTAANYLDRSSVLRAAIERVISAFPAKLGL